MPHNPKNAGISNRDPDIYISDSWSESDDEIDSQLKRFKPPALKYNDFKDKIVVVQNNESLSWDTQTKKQKPASVRNSDNVQKATIKHKEPTGNNLLHTTQNTSKKAKMKKSLAKKVMNVKVTPLLIDAVNNINKNTFWGQNLTQAEIVDEIRKTKEDELQAYEDFCTRKVVRKGNEKENAKKKLNQQPSFSKNQVASSSTTSKSELILKKLTTKNTVQKTDKKSIKSNTEEPTNPNTSKKKLQRSIVTVKSRQKKDQHRASSPITEKNIFEYLSYATGYNSKYFESSHESTKNIETNQNEIEVESATNPVNSVVKSEVQNINSIQCDSGNSNAGESYPIKKKRSRPKKKKNIGVEKACESNQNLLQSIENSSKTALNGNNIDVDFDLPTTSNQMKQNALDKCCFNRKLSNAADKTSQMTNTDPKPHVITDTKIMIKNIEDIDICKSVTSDFPDLVSNDTIPKPNQDITHQITSVDKIHVLGREIIENINQNCSDISVNVTDQIRGKTLLNVPIDESSLVILEIESLLHELIEGVIKSCADKKNNLPDLSSLLKFPKIISDENKLDILQDANSMTKKKKKRPKKKKSIKDMALQPVQSSADSSRNTSNIDTERKNEGIKDIALQPDRVHSSAVSSTNTTNIDTERKNEEDLLVKCQTINTEKANQLRKKIMEEFFELIPKLTNNPSFTPSDKILYHFQQLNGLILGKEEMLEEDNAKKKEQTNKEKEQEDTAQKNKKAIYEASTVKDMKDVILHNLQNADPANLFDINGNSCIMFAQNSYYFLKEKFGFYSIEMFFTGNKEICRYEEMLKLIKKPETFRPLPGEFQQILHKINLFRSPNKMLPKWLGMLTEIKQNTIEHINSNEQIEKSDNVLSKINQSNIIYGTKINEENIDQSNLTHDTNRNEENNDQVSNSTHDTKRNKNNIYKLNGEITIDTLVLDYIRDRKNSSASHYSTAEEFDSDFEYGRFEEKCIDKQSNHGDQGSEISEDLEYLATESSYKDSIDTFTFVQPELKGNMTLLDSDNCLDTKNIQQFDHEKGQSNGPSEEVIQVDLKLNAKENSAYKNIDNNLNGDLWRIMYEKSLVSIVLSIFLRLEDSIRNCSLSPSKKIVRHLQQINKHILCYKYGIIPLPGCRLKNIIERFLTASQDTVYTADNNIYPEVFTFSVCTSKINPNKGRLWHEMLNEFLKLRDQLINNNQLVATDYLLNHMIDINKEIDTKNKKKSDLLSELDID